MYIGIREANLSKISNKISLFGYSGGILHSELNWTDASLR